MNISLACMNQAILCMTLRLRRSWLHLSQIERVGGCWDCEERVVTVFIPCGSSCHVLIWNILDFTASKRDGFVPPNTRYIYL